VKVEELESTGSRLWPAIRKATAGLTIGLLLSGHVAAAEPTESPTAVVRSTLDAVFRILEDKSLKAPGQSKPRRQMLEGVIGERFDYEEMSKRTLATHWKSLNQAERQEFIQLFKAFLSDRYAARIESYSGEKAHYLSERLSSGYAEVRTKLVSDKLELPMDYRLIARDGKWYAYDVIVDGVSLVMNYRSQFTHIIADSSFQELVRRLREGTVTDTRRKS
jgi:phospholipid transport system substrate-binding protein